MALTEKIAKRHVLLAENDIVDYGVTAQLFIADLNEYKLASLAICLLLNKPANRQIERLRSSM